MANDHSTAEGETVNEVFSDYVARLGEKGEPPDRASYEEVRKSLRSVLISQMRRRGLWWSPPSFLGMTGTRWDGATLDELVSDVYSYNFIHRLRGLRNQQRLRGNIRPLVVLNVRNLLTERQKKADPVGYRVFGRLRAAVEAAIDRDEIMVRDEAEGAAKRALGNSTVLSFAPGLAPLAPRRDFEEPVRRWNDGLLPDLITAEGRSVPKIERRLAEKVVALKSDGVDAFLFGDLIAELKDDVRKRFEGIWRQSLGELAWESGGDDTSPTPVPIEWPDEEPDWPRRRLLIQDCVAAKIDGQRPPKSRRDLWNLWLLIRSTRLQPQEVGPIPCYAELGRQLKLSGQRVRQLFERLRPLVEGCLKCAGRSPEPEVAANETPRVARRGG